jgi:organic radical activating enzyme
MPPVKLLQSESARKLLPAHVSWFPTNRCNLNCDFCSCAQRDTSLSMDGRFREVIDRLAQWGCKAVSISGGGEPLCHPDLAEMIARLRSHGIKVGMTTNGTLLHRLDKKTLGMLSWCRISNDDSRTFDDDYEAKLDRATEVDIDWAFSHVIGESPNIDEILRILDYAERRNFTHVRLLADVRDVEAVDLESVRAAIAGKDQRAFFQDRQTVAAVDSCMLGYVKPVIAPDWKMYLCCNVQFQNDMPLDMQDAFCMGSALDLDAVYGNGRAPFAVKCDRCYYAQLNDAVKVLASGVTHEEFL